MSISRALAEISKWIDNYEPNMDRDSEAMLWSRVSKIGEEFGEVIAAMVGLTNQNPRKGVTHSINDLRKELLDVALTALAAYEHTYMNVGIVMDDFAAHVAYVHGRALSK